jgi:hypothetical protein
MTSHILLLLASLAVAPGQSPAQGALRFNAPQGWQPRDPSSTMRVAEFVLAGKDGAAGNAEIVLSYFGGSGGSVDANIQRWLGQMLQPDGRASADVAVRETRTINGLNVSLLDVTGTDVAEVRPGATEKHNSPGYRMRTAVVETARGPYYLKLVGPAATVGAWNASVDQFIASFSFGQ